MQLQLLGEKNKRQKQITVSRHCNIDQPDRKRMRGHFDGLQLLEVLIGNGGRRPGEIASPKQNERHQKRS